MPTLMGLPNEILTAIIEAAEPDDMESFSTCCKLIHSLASRRLEEHREKKMAFSTIFVQDSLEALAGPLFGAKYDKSNVPLREFFSAEPNRLYPKELAVRLFFGGHDPITEFEYGGTAWRCATNDHDEVEEQVDCRIAEVHSMIGMEIGGIAAKEWGKHVKSGYPVAMFLFLLALLPNLEKLHIDSLDYQPETPCTDYSTLMRFMTDAALERKDNKLSFGGRISECTVIGVFGEGIEQSLVPFLMMLPRMQRIEGFSLCKENCSWPYADALSPVVDLDLEGAIDAVTLGGYIRGVRELKRFRYEYDCNEGDGWEPGGIVATLVQFAFRSLVCLSLTAYASPESILSPDIASLRSFEVLESVRLHYLLLFEGAQTPRSASTVNPAQILEDLHNNSLVKAKTLIDFLPCSVKDFSLEDITESGFILDIFEGFKKHRVERLPKLHLITLEVGDEINNQIDTICRESAVHVIWVHKKRR